LAQAFRHGRSRLMERRHVSCEVLEVRRLMSTGMPFGQQAGAIAISTSPGWESRWVELAPTPVSTGAQEQFVSNLRTAGLGAVLEMGSGAGLTEITSASGGGSATGSTITSPSINPLPAAVNLNMKVAAPVASISTLAAPLYSISTLPAVVKSTNTLPAAINVTPGGGQGLVVSPANDGVPVTASPIAVPVTASPIAVPVTASPIAAPPETVEVGSAGAPTEIESVGSDGSTTGSTVASSPVNMLPMITQVGTGGLQGQVMSENGAGSMSPMMVATPLMPLPPGSVGIVPVSAPMQLASGTQSQSSASSTSSG
jgi:hypothetical protein